MTNEQQIKALAELDGLVGTWQNTQHVLVDGSWKVVPSYLTSYDAIIPLIQKQPLEIRDRIATKGGPISFMVTPAQLAKKLLRETNRWTE